MARLANAGPSRRPSAWRDLTGLSLSGTVSLVAVVAVLVFVSLPRLRGFAQHENEVDARATVVLLAQRLGAHAAPGAVPPPIVALADVAEIRQALSDGEFIDDGQRLVRHGYLFAVVALEGRPPVASGTGRVVHAGGPAPTRGVLAWPWRRGHSGAVALLGTMDGAVFLNTNDGARWSGPEAVLAPWSWKGWRRVR